MEDLIFWYKAEMHGDFRIGAPEFWSHSAMHYRDKDEDNINSYDPTAMRKLKGPAIQVKKT